MSDNLKLGQIITTPQHRDAIHIAVAPVKASEPLRPGQRICLEEMNGYARGEVRGNAIGVVDPFLTTPVGRGETFWLFLFPGTITALRHEWTHPAFGAGAVNAPAAIAASKAWLEIYIRRVCPYDNESPDGGYAAFMAHVKDGEIFYHGSDCHNSGDVEDAEELYRHLSVVLGRTIDRSTFEEGGFHCSC